MRYSPGIMDLELRLKPPKSNDVVASGDANFSATISHSGAVVKTGDNTNTWRSLRQPQTGTSTTSRQMKATAATAVLGDMVQALKESVMNPTNGPDTKWDNKATISFSTGLVSWRAKHHW